MPAILCPSCNAAILAAAHQRDSLACPDCGRVIPAGTPELSEAEFRERVKRYAATRLALHEPRPGKTEG